MIPATKATRTTRPLIEYPAYFERDYCPECMNVHMVEKARSGKIVCHGEDYYFKAQTARTHYSRRLGKGFELIPMTPYTKQIALTLDWQIAQEASEQQPEYIDIDQDW